MMVMFLGISLTSLLLGYVKDKAMAKLLKPLCSLLPS